MEHLAAHQERATNLHQYSPSFALSLYQSCLEAGLVACPSPVRKIADLDAFTDILDSCQPILDHQLSLKALLDSIPLPSDFDGLTKSRQAVRDAITTTFHIGLIDRRTLAYSLKFASPTSTYYLPNLHKATYACLKNYPHKVRQRSITSSKKFRALNSYITIGGELVNSTARQFINTAQGLSIALTPHQALDLAFFSIASHEFAHGIDQAVTTLGGSTQTSALHLPPPPHTIYSRRTNPQVHSEHLARGFQEATLPIFASQSLGIDPTSTHALVDHWLLPGHLKARQATQLVTLAESKGWQETQLALFERAVNITCQDYPFFSQHLNHHRLEVRHTMLYNKAPYSPDQLTHLIQTPTFSLQR